MADVNFIPSSQVTPPFFCQPQKMECWVVCFQNNSNINSSIPLINQISKFISTGVISKVKTEIPISKIIKKHEWEVIFLLMAGLRLKQIAFVLKKTYSTVQSYKNGVVDKLREYDVNNTEQLISFIYECNWEVNIPDEILKLCTIKKVTVLLESSEINLIPKINKLPKIKGC